MCTCSCMPTHTHRRAHIHTHIHMLGMICLLSKEWFLDQKHGPHLATFKNAESRAPPRHMGAESAFSFEAEIHFR